MPVTTRTLTIQTLDLQDQPAPNARISIRLNRADIDADGIVIPVTNIEAVADAEGLAEISLWPNALGSQDTRYLVTIRNAAGNLVLFRGRFYMPDTDSHLSSLLALGAVGLGQQAQFINTVLALIKEAGGDYELPQATAEILGGLKLGEGLIFNEETGRVDAEIPEPENSLLEVKAGYGINVTNGTPRKPTISVKPEILSGKVILWENQAAAESVLTFGLEDGEPAILGDVANSVLTYVAPPSDKSYYAVSRIAQSASSPYLPNYKFCVGVKFLESAPVTPLQQFVRIRLYGSFVKHSFSLHRLAGGLSLFVSATGLYTDPIPYTDGDPIWIAIDPVAKTAQAFTATSSTPEISFTLPTGVSWELVEIVAQHNVLHTSPAYENGQTLKTLLTGDPAKIGIPVPEGYTPLGYTHNGIPDEAKDGDFLWARDNIVIHNGITYPVGSGAIVADKTDGSLIPIIKSEGGNVQDIDLTSIEGNAKLELTTPPPGFPVPNTGTVDAESQVLALTAPASSMTGGEAALATVADGLPEGKFHFYTRISTADFNEANVVFSLCGVYLSDWMGASPKGILAQDGVGLVFAIGGSSTTLDADYEYGQDICVWIDNNGDDLTIGVTTPNVTTSAISTGLTSADVDRLVAVIAAQLTSGDARYGDIQLSSTDTNESELLPPAGYEAVITALAPPDLPSAPVNTRFRVIAEGTYDGIHYKEGEYFTLNDVEEKTVNPERGLSVYSPENPQTESKPVYITGVLSYEPEDNPTWTTWKEIVEATKNIIDCHLAVFLSGTYCNVDGSIVDFRHLSSLTISGDCNFNLMNGTLRFFLPEVYNWSGSITTANSENLLISSTRSGAGVVDSMFAASIDYGGNFVELSGLNLASIATNSYGLILRDCLPIGTADLDITASGEIELIDCKDRTAGVVDHQTFNSIIVSGYGNLTLTNSTVDTVTCRYIFLNGSKITTANTQCIRAIGGVSVVNNVVSTGTSLLDYPLVMASNGAVIAAYNISGPYIDITYAVEGGTIFGGTGGTYATAWGNQPANQATDKGIIYGKITEATYAQLSDTLTADLFPEGTEVWCSTYNVKVRSCRKSGSAFWLAQSTFSAYAGSPNDEVTGTTSVATFREISIPTAILGKYWSCDTSTCFSASSFDAVRYIQIISDTETGTSLRSASDTGSRQARRRISSTGTELIVSNNTNAPTDSSSTVTPVATANVNAPVSIRYRVAPTDASDHNYLTALTVTVFPAA